MNDVKVESIQSLFNDISISYDESVYVRGALRREIKLLKSGDERDFILRFLTRLEQMMFNVKVLKEDVF